jgi:hypothetical protein
MINNEKFRPKENMLFGKLLVGMKETFFSGYFTGSSRNRHDPSIKTQGHSEHKSNYDNKK